MRHPQFYSPKVNMTMTPPSRNISPPPPPQPQLQNAGTFPSPNCLSSHLHKAYHTPTIPLPTSKPASKPPCHAQAPLTSLPHQAYNSIFNIDSQPPHVQNIGAFPLLPLRTRVRGPAYTLPADPSLPAHLSPEPDAESYDALDEVLSLFRANTFFRNFEIQGPADRLLIYGILWVSECLGKIRPSMGSRCVDVLFWSWVGAWGLFGDGWACVWRRGGGETGRWARWVFRDRWLGLGDMC